MDSAAAKQIAKTPRARFHRPLSAQTVVAAVPIPNKRYVFW